MFQKEIKTVNSAAEKYNCVHADLGLQAEICIRLEIEAKKKGAGTRLHHFQSDLGQFLLPLNFSFL